MKEKIPLDLRVTRIRSGLSNRDLSHLLDCNKERVSKLEHGKARITAAELIALGVIYGQTAEVMFRETIQSIMTGLKEQLASMPQQPSNWSKHERARSYTLNGLAFRLNNPQLQGHGC